MSSPLLTQTQKAEQGVRWVCKHVHHTAHAIDALLDVLDERPRSTQRVREQLISALERMGDDLRVAGMAIHEVITKHKEPRSPSK